MGEGKSHRKLLTISYDPIQKRKSRGRASTVLRTKIDSPRRPTASSADCNSLFNLGRSGKPQETAERGTVASVASAEIPEFTDDRSTDVTTAHAADPLELP